MYPDKTPPPYTEQAQRSSANMDKVETSDGQSLNLYAQKGTYYLEYRDLHTNLGWALKVWDTIWGAEAKNTRLAGIAGEHIL